MTICRIFLVFLTFETKDQDFQMNVLKVKKENIGFQKTKLGSCGEKYLQATIRKAINNMVMLI